MTSTLAELIVSTDPAVRDQSLEAICAKLPLPALVKECADLDAFRRRSENLYQRVRALFFLYAIHRFHLPSKPGMGQRGLIPFRGYEHLLQRRFEEAIENFLSAQKA